ncbi:hypothetical protein ROZALSC1DRAFT_24675 [Rozella allomycis CSF55]|uniref:Uncharacterized protein n=1 Tax=Rozella allomycis (strain CSF55) TaxID=988480 RepID=A0A4P9YCB1_ROZAC|nr:hypothetical protein ROZALSC1DRAFT_24675 [Rozella allomycis CSF55]
MQTETPILQDADTQFDSLETSSIGMQTETPILQDADTQFDSLETSSIGMQTETPILQDADTQFDPLETSTIAMQTGSPVSQDTSTQWEPAETSTFAAQTDSTQPEVSSFAMQTEPLVLQDVSTQSETAGSSSRAVQTVSTQPEFSSLAVQTEPPEVVQESSTQSEHVQSTSIGIQTDHEELRTQNEDSTVGQRSPPQAISEESEETPSFGARVMGKFAQTMRSIFETKESQKSRRILQRVEAVDHSVNRNAGRSRNLKSFKTNKVASSPSAKKQEMSKQADSSKIISTQDNVNIQEPIHNPLKAAITSAPTVFTDDQQEVSERSNNEENVPEDFPINDVLVNDLQSNPNVPKSKAKPKMKEKVLRPKRRKLKRTKKKSAKIIVPNSNSNESNQGMPADNASQSPPKVEEITHEKETDSAGIIVGIVTGVSAAAGLGAFTAWYKSKRYSELSSLRLSSRRGRQRRH